MLCDIQTNKHNCRPTLKLFLIEFENTSREDKADADRLRILNAIYHFDGTIDFLMTH